MFVNCIKHGFKACISHHRNKYNFYSTLVKEQKVIVNGINLNYVKSGEGKNAVLCLPGALGSAWSDFKPQIEKLPSLLKDTTLIAWDPPGYGASRPPIREFGVNFFENDSACAYDLMLTLGYEKFSLLGWSDGGITALIIAGNHSENIQNLIIWGANSYVIKEELTIYEGLRDVEKWSQKMRDPLEKIYGPEHFREMWQNWIDAFMLIYKERKGDICKASLPKIKCPTLIVHGAKDPMIASEHVPYLLNNINNAKSFVFPDGKHNIHLRYADEFNKVVADFLNKTNI